MIKKVSLMLSLVLIALSISVSSIVSTANILDDGNYTIAVYAWHAQNDYASMMASALDSKASIIIENGEITATIRFVETSIFGVSIDGDSVLEIWSEEEGIPIAGSGIAGVLNPSDNSKTFTIPLSNLNMTKLDVNVGNPMNGIQTIRLKFDLDTMTPEGEASKSYTVTGKAQVEQFGKYDVNVTVTITDGKISKVDVLGSGYSGTYAELNPIILQQAINGIKDRFIGLPINSVSDVSGVDVVSGATYSSKAIIKAVMDALDLQLADETSNVPETLPAVGIYEVEVAYYTDVVYHSLLKNDKGCGLLTISEDGNAILSLDLISGTTTEPLYLLAFNGYYDAGELKTDNVSIKTMEMDEYTVCRQITFPLIGLSELYSTNTYMYVPAMKNLNGELSGIMFDNGKFCVDSFVKIYWDTLTKKDLVVRDAASNKLMPSTEYIAEYTGSSGLFEGIMLVAMYDSDGRLIKIIPGIQGSSSVSFSVTNPAITDIKLMLWQNFNTIAPLSGASLYQINK